MSRAVYIGGFGNGRMSADGVAEALTAGGYYEDADAFTFAYTMDTAEVGHALTGADVFTHSAGLLAINSAYEPNSITAFNAPLPMSKRRLIGQTVVKTAHMHMPGRGIKSAADIPAVTRYDISSVGELAFHPVANLREIGFISRANGIRYACRATFRGIPANLVYTEQDDYFQLSYEDKVVASRYHIPLTILPGEHDELVLRPDQTLANYFETATL